MKRQLAAWNRDERGAVIASELVLIGTIMVLGVITGLTCLQSAVVEELTEIGGAFRSLNQSYGFSGFKGTCKVWGPVSWTSGSYYRDLGHVQTAWAANEFVDVNAYGVTVGTGPATIVAPAPCQSIPSQLVPSSSPCAVGTPCPAVAPGCVTPPLLNPGLNPSLVPSPLPAPPLPPAENPNPAPLPEPEPILPPVKSNPSAMNGAKFLSPFDNFGQPQIRS